MRKITIVGGLLLALVITAMLVNRISTRPFSAGISEPAALQDGASRSKRSAQLKFSIVVSATVMAPEAAMFEGGRWSQTRKMGHAAIAICHPDGLLLFDTGLGRDIDRQFADMSIVSKQFFSYEVIEPVADQLDRDVFCPNRPLQIVLSHLHWDHASGINDFPNTPIWTDSAEKTAALAAGNSHAYLQSQFDRADINWRQILFTDQPYFNYKQSVDFFGDGAVILVPMKGHTPGAIGLFLNSGDGQTYLFSGDTTWSVEGFSGPAHKHALMRLFVDRDVGAVEQEIRRVNVLMQQRPELVVVPAHDYNAYPRAAIYPLAKSLSRAGESK